MKYFLGFATLRPGFKNRRNEVMSVAIGPCDLFVLCAVFWSNRQGRVRPKGWRAGVSRMG
jgi:hypothetical protein